MSYLESICKHKLMSILFSIHWQRCTLCISQCVRLLWKTVWVLHQYLCLCSFPSTCTIIQITWEMYNELTTRARDLWTFFQIQRNLAVVLPERYKHHSNNNMHDIHDFSKQLLISCVESCYDKEHWALHQ